MNILWSILIGAVVGALADYIVKGIDVSLIVKIIVGILGVLSVVGCLAC